MAQQQTTYKTRSDTSPQTGQSIQDLFNTLGQTATQSEDDASPPVDDQGNPTGGPSAAVPNAIQVPTQEQAPQKTDSGKLNITPETASRLNDSVGSLLGTDKGAPPTAATGQRDFASRVKDFFNDPTVIKATIFGLGTFAGGPGMGAVALGNAEEARSAREEQENKENVSQQAANTAQGAAAAQALKGGGELDAQTQQFNVMANQKFLQLGLDAQTAKTRADQISQNTALDYDGKMRTLQAELMRTAVANKAADLERMKITDPTLRSIELLKAMTPFAAMQANQRLTGQPETSVPDFLQQNLGPLTKTMPELAELYKQPEFKEALKLSANPEAPPTPGIDWTKVEQYWRLIDPSAPSVYMAKRLMNMGEGKDQADAATPVEQGTGTNAAPTPPAGVKPGTKGAAGPGNKGADAEAPAAGEGAKPKAGLGDGSQAKPYNVSTPAEAKELQKSLKGSGTVWYVGGDGKLRSMKT